MSDHVTEQAYQEWRQERVRRVAQAVEAALQADKCELRATPVILEDGRIGANIVIVAL